MLIHPNLTLRRRVAPSRRVGHTDVVAILRDAVLRTAPQDEVIGEAAVDESAYRR